MEFGYNYTVLILPTQCLLYMYYVHNNLLFIYLSTTYVQIQQLTAAMDGFLSSPAGGCVTSAPMKITGLWNTVGLQCNNNKHDHMSKKSSSCTFLEYMTVQKIHLLYFVHLASELWVVCNGLSKTLSGID